MNKADERALRAIFRRCQMRTDFSFERNRLEMLLERVLGVSAEHNGKTDSGEGACVGLAANALRKVVEKKHD